MPRSRSPGIAAICRDLVEAGEPDQPAEVWIGGARCLTIRSLHRYALTTIVEEPSVRMVPWTPHPMAVVGPRVTALLEAREVERREREIDRRLRKEYGA